MQARKGGVKHGKTYLGEISYPNMSCLGSHVYVEYNEHCTSCSCGVEEHVEARTCSPESASPLPSIPSFLLSPVPRALHSGRALAAGLHGRDEAGGDL